MSSDRTKAFAVNLEAAGYDTAKAKNISEVCAAAALDLEDEAMFETYKSGVLLTCADADFATALETMLDEINADTAGTFGNSRERRIFSVLVKGKMDPLRTKRGNSVSTSLSYIGGGDDACPETVFENLLITFFKVNRVTLSIDTTPCSPMIRFVYKGFKLYLDCGQLFLRNWPLSCSKTDFDSKQDASLKEQITKAIVGEDIPADAGVETSSGPHFRQAVSLLMTALVISGSIILAETSVVKFYKTGPHDVSYKNAAGIKVVVLGTNFACLEVLKVYDSASREGMSTADAHIAFKAFWKKLAEYLAQGYLVNTAVMKALHATSGKWKKGSSCKDDERDLDSLVKRAITQLMPQMLSQMKPVGEIREKPPKKAKLDEKICSDFQDGKCKNKCPCPNGKHKCSKCREGGHGLAKCKK